MLESAWLLALGLLLMATAVVLFVATICADEFGDDEHSEGSEPTRHAESPPSPETD